LPDISPGTLIGTPEPLFDTPETLFGTPEILFDVPATLRDAPDTESNTRITSRGTLPANGATSLRQRGYGRATAIHIDRVR